MSDAPHTRHPGVPDGTNTERSVTRFEWVGGPWDGAVEEVGGQRSLITLALETPTFGWRRRHYEVDVPIWTRADGRMYAVWPKGVTV